MDAALNTITVSCHCGAARQTVAPRGDGDLFSGVTFCHCDTCRHATGLLCTSYAPIAAHSAPSLAGLESYSASPTSTRYFCSTCGCHVFRASRPSPSASPEQCEWSVATGVIVDAPDVHTAPSQWTHQHVDDTKDGGLSAWLPNTGTLPLTTTTTSSTAAAAASASSDDTLSASCHCTAISLRITRPSPDPSANPSSAFPDLLLPYHCTPPATVSNPADSKWYLRPVPSSSQDNPAPQQHHKTRYLAGTCACASCRLTSGFEIQTWAFIPRRNISILLTPSSSPDSKSKKYEPLDFTSSTPPLPLKAYSATPDRTREFCPRCGATIFWHDEFRPDLLDVSAGLFRSPTGSRAEEWLAWWTGRVSFAEEAGTGRRGGAKTLGVAVVGGLEAGMRASHGHEQ